MILHGRRVCKPKPQCDRCAARDECAYYAKLGAARFYVTVMLFLMMMSLPLKMLARWIFNLKYVVAIPEIFFNI